jgi:hypothetical protein
MEQFHNLLFSYIKGQVSHFFRLETVAKDMLQDNKEMLERNVIRVQLPAKLQAAVYHLRIANPQNLKGAQA